MPLLNQADALYLGTDTVDAVYLGSEQVWPSGFDPTTIAGLTVWHDAADYTAGSWPNRVGGAPSFVGSPNPIISPDTLNGLPVVRFTYYEGRLRGSSGLGGGLGLYRYTIVYITRLWGAHAGRAFAGLYPETNFVLGFHSSGYDWMYAGGYVNSPTGWPSPGPLPWILYGGDGHHDGTVYQARFYKNGTKIGDASSGLTGGLGSGYNISGYDATEPIESMDCEIAELLIYNRRLTDPERVSVETYLQDKWGL